jgi:hypothetical protein
MARPRRPEDRQQRKEAIDRFHGAVQRAVNSPKFKDALADFEENPQAAQQDPKGFLEQRGVQLPDEAEVSVIERPGSACWCWRVCVLWWCWDACVCID